MKTEDATPFSRTNPFFAKIKERKRLSKEGSKKNTHHIVLDISGSNIDYAVGDSIGIYPKNDPYLVNWTLRALNATGNEQIKNKEGILLTLRLFFEEKANITEISKKFLSELAKRQTNPEKKAKLDLLLEENQKEALKEYQSSHELWDTLEENREAVFDIQELSHLLMPLLPRLYSISSSKKAVGDEVHLTVAMLEYESNQLLRRGVCTHYLCNLAVLQQPEVGVYIQPHHGFTLPENLDAQMIMVGPGTGVAPFRAFMQEREKLNTSEKNSGQNWLIFGEWNENFDFFYEEEWQRLVKQGNFRIDTAFSRDQKDKIYVQHRMWENGQEIYNWLQNGAFFYVCGDAKHMAKDVEAILLQIIQHFGHLDDTASKAYLKELRQQKRYLRDVY
ncbi:MAG TPA: sulfite reductase [Parachlamydiaceae bacterium]|nr:sulfite reductase [Parachlamydiaceae bacterium]